MQVVNYTRVLLRIVTRWEKIRVAAMCRSLDALRGKWKVVYVGGYSPLIPRFPPYFSRFLPRSCRESWPRVWHDSLSGYVSPWKYVRPLVSPSRRITRQGFYSCSTILFRHGPPSMLVRKHWAVGKCTSLMTDVATRATRALPQSIRPILRGKFARMYLINIDDPISIIERYITKRIGSQWKKFDRSVSQVLKNYRTDLIST